MSTETLSLFLLIAVAFCGTSLSYNDDDQISANDQVVINFLENNILGVIDSSQFCDDPYLALCGIEAENHTRPTHLKQAYRNIRDYLINVLQQPVAINEVTSLSVEKTLFRQCMNLGLNTDTVNLHQTEMFLQDLNDNVLNREDSWDNVDNKLNSLGFGFTFFDIGVERDPRNPRQNIIVIQPPSAARINTINEWRAMVFDPENPPNQTQIPWKFLDTIDRQVSVKRLFNNWIEIISKSSKQPKQARMSLNKWIELYNTKSSEKPAQSKINWQKLVVQTFEPFNINVQENDDIIVRNKNYFFSLAELLGDNKNEVIVDAIKMKIILEDIRLVDFKYANILKHRKKSLFCFENTKLYGASYRLLRDLKRDDLNDAANYEILNDMILSIVDVFNYKIDESSDLNPKERRYLKAQVKLITSHVAKYKNTRATVDDYYENYNTDHSYFVSILKYRKILKDKELKSLIDRPELSATEPFSVIDLAKPRNRFSEYYAQFAMNNIWKKYLEAMFFCLLVINVFASSFLLSKQPIPAVLQKEVHYGIYGVSIASFLYGLLNENRFNNEMNLMGRVNWFAHPNYPVKSLKCFVGEDIKSYGWGLASEAVTQIFGARIAYNATLEDYEESDLDRPKEFLVLNPKSELEVLEADKLFFMSFTKYNCHLGQKLLRTILLNLDEYNVAFKCKWKNREFNSQCPLDTFQIQSKHHFINKPF